MATNFSDIESAVRADTSLRAASEMKSEDIFRFIRAAYHEMFHTRPDLRTQFDETTGAITRLPEYLADDADVLPDFFDGWFSAVQHYVKWRMLTMYRMDAAQQARAKLEDEAFKGEMGTYQLQR